MQPLLLLHGALATKHQFDSILPKLQQSLKADAIDFTGHGGLNIPVHGYTFKAFAHDILTYADKNHIEKINLFGYSMGGYAALYFAKLFPDRVNRIMALNTKFNWDPLSTAKETALLDAEKMITQVPGYANQLMLLHGLTMWKQVIAQTAEMMNNLAKEVMLIDEDFTIIKCPVMLAIGDKDRTSSIEENLHVYRLLKNGSLWVLPHTPHSFEKVNEADLITQMLRFFID